MFKVKEAADALFQFITEHRWMICQAAFALYMIVLSVRDIRERRMSLLLLLSGVPLAVGSFFCGRDVPAVILISGAAVGIVFLAVSRGTKEAFGYGDSLLIVIMGMMLGFWEILSVLLAAFLLAAVFSAVLLFRNHFDRKASFPFVPFLTAAYIGGMFLGGY